MEPLLGALRPIRMEKHRNETHRGRRTPTAIPSPPTQQLIRRHVDNCQHVVVGLPDFDLELADTTLGERKESWDQRGLELVDNVPPLRLVPDHIDCPQYMQMMGYRGTRAIQSRRDLTHGHRPILQEFGDLVSDGDSELPQESRGAVFILFHALAPSCAIRNKSMYTICRQLSTHSPDPALRANKDLAGGL
jgi:hypothetical protein